MNVRSWPGGLAVAPGSAALSHPGSQSPRLRKVRVQRSSSAAQPSILPGLSCPGKSSISGPPDLRHFDNSDFQKCGWTGWSDFCPGGCRPPKSIRRCSRQSLRATADGRDSFAALQGEILSRCDRGRTQEVVTIRVLSWLPQTETQRCHYKLTHKHAFLTYCICVLYTYKSHETLRYWCRTCATPRGSPHIKTPITSLLQQTHSTPQAVTRQAAVKILHGAPGSLALRLCSFIKSCFVWKSQVYFTEATVHERWLATVGGESDQTQLRSNMLAMRVPLNICSRMKQKMSVHVVTSAPSRSNMWDIQIMIWMPRILARHSKDDVTTTWLPRRTSAMTRIG